VSASGHAADLHVCDKADAMQRIPLAETVHETHHVRAGPDNIQQTFSSCSRGSRNITLRKNLTAT